MNLHEVATCLLEEFDARRPSAIFGRSDLNLSIDNAYDVQFKVAAMRQSRGERVAGYKIGCISDTMQRQLGIDHPVFGHVWDSEIHRSGAHLRPQDFDGLAIEGELAIRLQDDVPSSAWLRNNPEVVARHLAVIELHNYVFRGAESNRAAELVTNNAIHAGVVIADEEAASNNFNPNSILQVDRNAERLGEGVAPHLQNGPVDIVAAVSEHLERHGLHLMRDQIILTGSPLPLWRVAPGDRITVRCDGLADVSCTIRGVALTNCSTGAAAGRVFCVSEVADHRPVTGLMNTILTALIAYTFYPTKPEMRGVVLQGAVVPITP